jgi:hypothetical protein
LRLSKFQRDCRLRSCKFISIPAVQATAQECTDSQRLLVDHVQSCCTKLERVKALAVDVRKLKSEVNSLYTLLLQVRTRSYGGLPSTAHQ